MALVERVETGVVFRNPKPHLRSVHGYFPWVSVLPSGDLLASLQVGSAFEAADGHCQIARSKDNGSTWTVEGPIHDGTGPDCPTSECLKVTADPAGHVVAFGTRFDRSDPEAAICNEANGGILPMELLMVRSPDEGRTWDEPRIVEKPIPGSFEAQAPIVVLSDGRWIVPMSTWRNWDGTHPCGDKCIALISEDKGETWPQVGTMFEDPEDRLVFWEVRIAEREPGELLAVGWAHDKQAEADIENQYALSHDGGLTWTPFRSAGFRGQSCCPVCLADGRVLFAYNYRYDEPGVRVRLAHMDDGEWVCEEEIAVWGVGAEGTGAERQSEKRMVQEMSSFKFGQPSPHLLPNGDVLTVHWCVEDCVSEIRWNRLRIS